MQAGRQQAQYPDPDWLLLAHSLSGCPLAARRDRLRSELSAKKGVEQFPEGTRVHLRQGSCSLLHQVCSALQRRDPPCLPTGLRAGDRLGQHTGRLMGASTLAPAALEQGGAAVPCCARRQRQAQQMSQWQQEGPRTAPRAPQAPRGHAAVLSLQAAVRPCLARLICVTATTSPLRSSRSLMLMTVNMKQRP